MKDLSNEINAINKQHIIDVGDAKNTQAPFLPFPGELGFCQALHALPFPEQHTSSDSCRTCRMGNVQMGISRQRISIHSSDCFYQSSETDRSPANQELHYLFQGYPNEAVREFAKEIDISCVKIEEVIGAGKFQGWAQ